MPNKSSHQHRSLYVGWALALVVASALLGTIAWRGWQEAGSIADDIAVVHAPNAVPETSSAPARPAPTHSAASASPPDVAAAHVRQAYWVLSAVALSCEGDRCMLSGTIRPPIGQADVDKRQEMLLGGLASVLAGDGYTMHVPFEMSEIDDNTFSIRALVTPVRRRIV